MRILFVIPYTPNKVRTRSYNLIRSMRQRGHELSLVCVDGEKNHKEDLAALQPDLEQVFSFSLPTWRSLLNCALAVPGKMPLQAAYSWDPRMARLVDDLAGPANGEPAYQVVHVEHLRGVRYGLTALRNPAAVPVVWDSVDSITHLFKQSAQNHPRPLNRWLLRLELQRTRFYEGWLANQFSRVLVTSPVDQQAFRELAPGAPVEVLPNGVDLEYFKPDDSHPREEERIVVSGKMSYHPNVSMVVHLARDIMPHVWKKRPQARLWVVGQNPSEEIMAACQDPRIEVTGRVADVRNYLQRASVAAAPVTYGAGIQNKVLEAMACATPVVASSLAVSALNITSGEEILVADDARLFAGHLVHLLEQAADRRRIGAAGRRYVEAHHSWDSIAESLEAIYLNAAP